MAHPAAEAIFPRVFCLYGSYSLYIFTANANGRAPEKTF